MYVSVNICREDYKAILRHLFPKEESRERVCFIFASTIKSAGLLSFTLKDWYAVKANQYKYQSRGYVELKDLMRGKIIKKAFDVNASIIEVHSHPYDTPAKFSYSDKEGFKEFVPHVWWRLRGKPYAALVFSQSDFDGLAWANSPQLYEPVTELLVDREKICANNLSA
jgi:hypothetical protein